MAYEKKRLPMTAEIVRSNRRGGPEGVIDAVEQLAPDGFTDIEKVLSYAQREAIVRGYASKAGFAAPPLGWRRCGRSHARPRSPDGAQRNPGRSLAAAIRKPRIALRSIPGYEDMIASRPRRRRQEVDVVLGGQRHHGVRLLLLHVVDRPEQVVEPPRRRHPEQRLRGAAATC